jgi:hypothetical protein
MPDLDRVSRDLLIRTVIGEADDQPALGQAAVAHVALNRLASGKYGKTMPDVLFAKGQWEPWDTRSNELINIPVNSDRYQRTAQIVDGVLAGKIADPTKGMTHFLEPNIVQQRYGRLPDWAHGQGLRIGSHVFYAPEGRVSGMPDRDYINDWLNAEPEAPKKSAPPAAVPAEARDYVGDWLSKDTESPAAPAAPSPSSSPTTAKASDRETIPEFINRITGEAHGHGPKNITDLVTGKSPDSMSDVAIRAAAGIGRGIGTVGDTLAQGIAALGERGASSLAAHGYLSPENAQAVSDWRRGVQSGIEANRAGYEASDPGFAGRLGEVGGEISGTAPMLAAGGGALSAVPGVTPALGAISRIPYAGRILGPALTGAATGAGTNVLTSAKSDTPVLEQARAGAEFGAPLGVVGSEFGRLFGIDRDTAQLAQTARQKFGIPVRWSQISENPTVRFMDSVLQRLPFTGVGPHSAQQQAALQRGLANEMGVASDKITPDVINTAKRTAYGLYDAAKANMGHLNLDQKFYQDLTDTLTNARYNLEKPQARLVEGHIGNVLDKVNQGTHTLDPDLFQSLTRENGPLDKAINSKDSKIGTYASDIKDALENLVGRNNPQMKALKDAADYKYFVAKSLEPLANEATTGNISPAKILKALDYSSTDAGELGRIARRFLVEPSSSGTAERSLLLQHLPQAAAGALGLGAVGLGGSTYIDPDSWQRNALIGAGTLAAGAGLGSVARSNTIANAMIRSGLRGNQPGGLNLLPGLATTQREPLRVTVHPAENP